VVFEDVPDGARMTRRSMEAAIARDLERRAPIAPGTIVVVVSGTGHPNHLATFDAASEVASAAGLPLYVAWGYDKGHDLESRPLTGTPLAFDGGPAASAAKALATDGYIGLYEDHYAFTLPRAIVLARGSHDVLSRIETTGGVGAP
jgi:LmbE family N-acetylglucosaminyl deacetylase